jgi:hypothetical protein
MAGTFPPDYFSPDYFAPDYFGGETDANAMSATIAGVATVTGNLTALSSSISATINGLSEVLATISVTSAAVEDDDSGYWARVVSDRRKKKLKAQKEYLLAALDKAIGEEARRRKEAGEKITKKALVEAVLNEVSHKGGIRVHRRVECREHKKKE